MKILIVQTMVAVAFCGIVCADQCPQTDREAQLAAARQQQRPESERQILRQLDVPITLNIDKPCTLEQALNMVCAQIDIVPTIDEAAFREANIWADKIVVLPWTYSGIRAKSVLNVILDQGDLVYTVNGGTFNITTKREKSRKMREEKFLQLHYVGDIVPVTPTASGIGVDGFTFDNIVELIQTVVEPDSWTDGGAFIAPHPATQSLAIRHFEDVHVQIEDMLNQMRKVNDEQQASSLLPTERNDNRPISVRERMRVRTVASPISLRQNRIVR